MGEKMNRRTAITTVLVTTALLFCSWFAIASAAEKLDIYSGYYSREGNDSKAAEVSGNSFYIKFYPDQWVVMLYVPYPYSLEVKPDLLKKVFAKIERKSAAYIKNDFGLLKEKAVAHVERFGMVKENEARFECDGMAPCQVIFEGDTLDMIKAGIISNHIIRFRRVK